MTTIHLLALAGYFIVLFEYIAMRHRVICAESDARMALRFDVEFDCTETFGDWIDVKISEKLYWNRGTK